ncbi:DUF2314 domain-containing protein [Aquimarina litoralis]|uniref:DUF2314 domain-containing protein n=1 Tax=Aquimarina litoralis TaxID=584605 RepID=UPI001C5652FE|nr:DUF2314 domain-containing protein [Aquimarina litoralis]MBW1294436.1 DUF2314 domain-containing protein [Aquimarina litoralis]
MRVFLLVIFSVVLICCQKQREYEIIENNIDLRNNDYMNSFGIYSLEDENLPSHEEVDSLFKSILPNYNKYNYRNERRSESGYYIESLNTLSGILTPPSISYLQTYGYGLTDSEKQRLQQCKNIYAITTYGGKKDAIKEQKEVYELLLQLAENKKYILVDFGTLEYFNPNSWIQKRIKPFMSKTPNIASQIRIKISQRTETNTCRAVTFGMEKFCLPDITIPDFSCNNKADIKTILELISQKLSENSFISSDSTLSITPKDIRNTHFNSLIKKRLAVDLLNIKLSAIKPIKGDKNNNQYRIDFVNPELINQLLKDNEIQYINHTNEILRLSNEAKKRLPDLKIAFNNHQLIDDFLLVKAPFQHNETKEWMWVEVTKWDNMTIIGKLYNSSNTVEHLKNGVLVSVNQKDIFDYIIKKEDGSFEGNETEKLIRAK